MTSGITRYTKGTYNASAILDVYNKAKEIYEDPVPPPSSGIIPNSVDLIWEDMTTSAEVSPVCTIAVFARGPNWKDGDERTPAEGGTAIPWNPLYPDDGSNQGPPGFVTQCGEWAKVNAWFEVEEDAGQPATWCAPTINKAVNTQVEISGLTAYWLDWDGNWHLVYKNTKNLEGATWPRESNYPVTRGCTEEAYQVYEDIRLQYPDYQVERGVLANGNTLYRPAHYWRAHMWASPAIEVPELQIDDPNSPSSPPGKLRAFYSCCWARNVLVDPNGIDDRWKARYIWHVSGDAKRIDGISACLSDIGGISKYKLVPQNGDWAPVNMIVGNITEEVFRANPPPFPTAP